MEENKNLFVNFDKVSDYIKKNLYKYLYCANGQAGFQTAQFIEDMKNQICEDRKSELIKTYTDTALGEGNYDEDALLADMNAYLKMLHNDQ